MRLPTICLSLLALSSTIAAGACAAAHTAPSEGARADAAESPACERVDQDSSATPHLPLYRACAVEVKARPTGTGPRPDYHLVNRERGCASVRVEFAVDTAGVPETGTAHVVRTNDPRFAEAVVATVPGLRFTPGRIGGAAVRQIFELRMAMTSQTVSNPSRGGGPQGPVPGSRPSCA